MTAIQLTQIRNFSIGNEFGRIDFKGLTDISYVDLHKSVTISPDQIKVDHIFKGGLSTGLKRPATVTLYNVPPAPNQSVLDKEMHLSTIPSITHLSYNNFEWRFKISQL